MNKFVHKIIRTISLVRRHLHQHKPHSLYRSIPVAAVFLEGIQQFSVDDVHRRHLTKSQQAMAMALSKPESKMGRGSDSAKVASQLGLSGELPRQARYVLRNNFTPENQQYPDRCLAVMAERIQARAIRRCGELLRQIEAGQGVRTDLLHDAADMKLTRTEAAREAGLSERQKVTALRAANVPAYAVCLPAAYACHRHLHR